MSYPTGSLLYFLLPGITKKSIKKLFLSFSAALHFRIRNDYTLNWKSFGAGEKISRKGKSGNCVNSSSFILKMRCKPFLTGRGLAKNDRLAPVVIHLVVKN